MLTRLSRTIGFSRVEGVVLALVVGIVGSLLLDDYRSALAKRRGEAEAEADIARGQFGYHLRGKPSAWGRNAIEIAKRDYGIRVVRTGGCVDDGGPACSFDHGYNRVMSAHFLHKFGKDPIADSRDKARSDWNRAYRAKSMGDQTSD